MDNKILLGIGLVILASVLLLFLPKPGQNFSCNNISEKVNISDRVIIVENKSCSFTEATPVDGRFSYAATME